MDQLAPALARPLDRLRRPGNGLQQRPRATCRLQPFFAATGFASAPLLLVGLSPIPCFGRVCGLVGVIWAFVVYIRANEQATHLPRLRSLAAVLLPLLFILIVTLSAIALVLLSVYLFAAGF